MTRAQEREAKRIGLQQAIDDSSDWAKDQHNRAIREENARRTALAQGQIAYPANSDIDMRYT